MLATDISLVITTYNRPAALLAVLRGLNSQTVQGFQVVIADDGSTSETIDLIDNFSSQYSLSHVWQPDNGFRAAAARNKAITQIKTPYVIFLDGDCIPLANFVEQHCKVAEQNCFVAGNRILATSDLTNSILENEKNMTNWCLNHWIKLRLKRKINRISPLLMLPNGSWRKYNQTWKGAKTCNLGVWLEDLKSINGFDERYQGWGHEDADLVVRLLRNKIKRKEGRFATPVLHLWHKENDRKNEVENFKRLQQIIAEQGLPQRL
jgi:glycosyltransferase involved in cell wall biosynthesis